LTFVEELTGTEALTPILLMGIDAAEVVVVDVGVFNQKHFPGR
jgi:hypothetical protein